MRLACNTSPEDDKDEEEEVIGGALSPSRTAAKLDKQLQAHYEAERAWKEQVKQYRRKKICFILYLVNPRPLPGYKPVWYILTICVLYMIYTKYLS